MIGLLSNQVINIIYQNDLTWKQTYFKCKCFFVSLFWQPPCFCFCVLGRAALTPCFNTPVKLYGVEALGNLQGRATHVSTLLLCIGQRGQRHCLASEVLPRKMLCPGTHLVASHFAFSVYATGALPVVALVLNPRGSGSV